MALKGPDNSCGKGKKKTRFHRSHNPGCYLSRWDTATRVAGALNCVPWGSHDSRPGRTFARESSEPMSKTEGRRRNENSSDGADTRSDHQVIAPCLRVQREHGTPCPGPLNAGFHPRPLPARSVARKGAREVPAGEDPWPAVTPAHPRLLVSSVGLDCRPNVFHNSDCFLLQQVHGNPRG